MRAEFVGACGAAAGMEMGRQLGTRAGTGQQVQWLEHLLARRMGGAWEWERVQVLQWQ